ncbi:MAG: DNA phosphorothioation system sulfurtransferase DndC [Rubrivivax sp.]
MATAPKDIIREIQELFLSDSLPWIVGYSGGKDSTASLQLIWTALSKLPPDRRRFKKVYVISTDTLVENPVISLWVTLSLQLMSMAASKQGLNIEARQLTPELENRFWVNLVGKGYPAPRPMFRWCTDRLKISASTKFIQNLSEANGEAILVLGQRRGESQARDKVIENYKSSTRERLSRNKDPKLSRVWVYLPIETWTSDDVWEYLIETPNPWGNSNQELFDLYRGATPDAECPIVVDKSTPSCGDSRFGCYVCTMVSQDKSMQAMIHNDEAKAWMQPIMDFRDRYLAVKDHEFREFKRIGGHITWKHGKLVPGPYTQERRAELLTELLKTQELVRTHPGNASLELIKLDELEEIRRIWVEEKGEIEDLLPELYEAATGHEYPGRELDAMPLESTDLALLHEAAQEWIADNSPAVDAVPGDERSTELYKLTRSLLTTGFRGMQSRKRSKQLDQLQKVLRDYAFFDRQDAVAFAEKYLADAAATRGPDEALDDEADPAGERDVIPITPIAAVVG